LEDEINAVLFGLVKRGQCYFQGKQRQVERSERVGGESGRTYFSNDDFGPGGLDVHVVVSIAVVAAVSHGEST
jgi:hypothetical protein